MPLMVVCGVLVVHEQIAMEFCGGGSVSDCEDILDEPLTEEQIAIICRQSLRGLEYLHNQKKIHRDIKAGNILLTKTGDIKLGTPNPIHIASATSHTHTHAHAHTHTRTRTAWC